MNLFKAASTVSLLTLASRITGLVREQLIAAAFGASGATDAFNVAFRIPNLLRRLFAEGAFSQAFVPVLAATRARDGDAATKTLIDAVASVLAAALLLTCIAGMAAAPVLVWLIGSGLAEFDLAATMTRWMFPYIAFMSLVALSAGVLADGYVAEVARTLYVGDPTDAVRALYRRRDDLWDRLLQACRPGAPVSSLLDAYGQAGEPLPAMPVAHGLGLGFDPPVVSPSLRATMVAYIIVFGLFMDLL